MDDISYRPMSGRSQSISFGCSISKDETVCYRVHQGSVLHTLMFLYAARVGKLIHSLDLLVHLYADDAQHHRRGKPCDLAILKQQKTLQSLHQVALWMASSRLRLNVGKTECMWFATASRQHLIDHSLNDLNGTAITLCSFVCVFDVYQ